MISTNHAYFFGIDRSGLVDSSAIESSIQDTFGLPENSLDFYNESLPEKLEVATVWRSQDLMHLFRYGAIAILQGLEWEETFTTYSSEADKVAKAIVLLKLHAFFNRSDIYHDEDELVGFITGGHFFNRQFYFIYLYEYISKNQSFKAIKQHGLNYGAMFGSRELVSEVLDGQAMKIFRAGLMEKLTKLVKTDDFTAIYKEYFEVAYEDQNKKNPITKSQFKEYFVMGLTVEGGSSQEYIELLEAVGF